ncbi:MAG: BlaI/MecI/CopY family transcriptional regulator [Candidatus Magasanikbacteria bacterium]|nr:BlaI/MecI/CopY family transcriptional regulator [Candidatus Magasanikbacteria bacterium]
MVRNTIKIFGDLEAEIMDIVWEAGQANVRDVLALLSKKRKIAYTTIMTVMARLSDKGVLKRRMDKSGAFLYVPVNDKKSFLENASEKIIKNFIKTYGDVAVAQFLDIIEKSDARQSGRWKEKLKKFIK